MGVTTLEYLDFALLFVGISHLDSKNSKRYKFKFIWQVYAIIFCASVNIPQIAFIVLNKNDPDLFFQGILFLGTFHIVLAKLICHMISRDDLKDIIQTFIIEDFERKIRFISNISDKSVEKNTLKLGEFLKKSKLSVLRTTKYLVAADNISGVMCVTLFLIAPIILGLVYPEDHYRELPMTVRFPYDEKTTPNYQITFVIHVYLAYFLAFGFVGPDSLYIVLIGHMVRQFWVIGYLMENMDELVSEFSEKGTEEWEDEFNRLLADCALHYATVKRYCERLNCALRPFLLLQAIYTAALLSISLFIIATSENILSAANVRYFSFQASGTIQIFIYSAGGQKIRDSSEELSERLDGSCRWWLHSRRFQSSLRIFMGHVAHPVTMTVWGSIELSYATFGAIVRTSMSYFTMLLSVTDG